MIGSGGGPVAAECGPTAKGMAGQGRAGQGRMMWPHSAQFFVAGQRGQGKAGWGQGRA